MKLTISVDCSQYHVIKTQTDTHKKKVSELNSINDPPSFDLVQFFKFFLICGLDCWFFPAFAAGKELGGKTCKSCVRLGKNLWIELDTFAFLIYPIVQRIVEL